MQNKQIFKWDAPEGQHKAVLIGYRYDWYGKFKKLIFTFRVIDNFDKPTDYTVGIPTNAPLDKDKNLDTDRIGNNSKSTPHWILKAITKKDEWDAFEQKIKHIDDLIYQSGKPIRIVEIKSIIKNNCSLLSEIYSDIEDAWVDIQRKPDNHNTVKKESRHTVGDSVSDTSKDNIDYFSEEWIYTPWKVKKDYVPNKVQIYEALKYKLIEKSEYDELKKIAINPTEWEMYGKPEKYAHL